MVDDYYEIHHFYGHKNQEGLVGQLMRAMDRGGEKKWRNMAPEEQTELVNRAKTSFEEPFNPNTDETAGGNCSVKYVFEATPSFPEGHLAVGRWWDVPNLQPEDYYRRMGWAVEVTSGVEGSPRSKEAM